MVQKETLLNVADNSGAKTAKVISVIGSTGKRFAYVGEKVKVAVKKAVPGGTVKKSDVVVGVLIRTKKEKRRANGSYVRFDDNAIVIVNDSSDPVGTRVFGPVSSELKLKGRFDKILSLAAQVY